MNQVEVVIVNWMRPRNVEKIVQALMAQSESCTITICDCHQELEFSLSKETLQHVDRVFRWEHNLGPYSRFVPIASFDHEYTFFLDDDLLPGKKCIEGFLRTALRLSDFGVLGQMGRLIESDGIYRPVDIKRINDLLEVDFVIRAYFTKTCHLFNVPRFKLLFTCIEQQQLEDDLLLCASMKYYLNLPCFLLPSEKNDEFLINIEELPTPYALSKRIDHRKRRISFVQMLFGIGWRSIFPTTCSQQKYSQ